MSRRWSHDRPSGAPAGLGRGLASLIPQRTRGQPAPTEIPHGPDPPEPVPAAPALRRGGAGHAHREHPRARRPPADPRDRDRSTATSSSPASGGSGPRIAAGLERIPAVVRQLADREQLELALVENLQRADLDPIEEARAFRQLIDEFGFTQEEVATRVGRARSTVANTLRLLDLAPAVQAAVAERPDHRGPRSGARRPRRPTPRRACSATVIAQDLSVRQTEELVRRLREPTAGAAAPTPQRPPTPTSNGSRRTSAARSAPRSASPARARAAGSSSSTTATRNWGVSTSA